jgi:hypothetical protein
MKWFVYEVANLSLNNWRAFAIRHDQILDNRDVHILARALGVLYRAEVDIDWLSNAHEYWITPCVGLNEIVCVRPNQNPYTSGFIVSPMLLPQLGDKVIEVEL